VQCLPDELWVGDEYAMSIAQSCFGELPVKLVSNPYVEDVRAELTSLAGKRPISAGKVVLYVCEPVRAHAMRQNGDERAWGYVEEEALEYFLQHLNAISADVTRIVVRPHPSEPPTKYDWVRARSVVPVEISTGVPLAHDVAAADMVVGCESMAMIVGLIGEKRVISSIPPGGRACGLPHRAIESLVELVSSGGQKVTPLRGQHE
jgi:hypothetical protein